MSNRLAPLLLLWFDANKRQFPWRKDRDPYRIWVSEVMLQQTVAATVVPFFDRFLERFPNVESLASAQVDEVLHHWQGLGYYRRARMLHQAAQKLVSLGHKNLPDDAEVVRALPGLGRYSTNAILSQAYGRPLPILEANTFRLLARLFGLLDDPRSKTSEAWLWEAAEALVPGDRPGDFNQALMELGSQLCVGESPSCLVCPAQALCVANLCGLQATIPNTPPKAATTSVSESSVGIVDEQGRWLVVRRPSKGRWGLMWEFPRVEINPGEEIIGAVKRAAFDLAGLRLVDPQKATKIHHAVTRFKVTLELWTAGMADPASKVLLSFHLESAWVYPKDFALLAAATPQRKLMAWIKQNHSPDGPSGAS